MKDTGCFYLHCDPTASHYLKIIIDSIFCAQNGIFHNEIVWKRTGSHNSTRSYGSIHDVILYYSKTNKHKFNIVRTPYMKGHVESRYVYDKSVGKMKFNTGGNILTGAGISNGDSGKTWKGFNPTSKNRHWAIPSYLVEDLGEDYNSLQYLKKLDHLYEIGRIEIKKNAKWPHPIRYLKETDGVPLQDIWACQSYTGGSVFMSNDNIDSDVQWLGTTDPERLGYPTQKPEGLMERIIKSSTCEGDIVLDAYCGCGTTVVASERLKRKWIGIDVTYQSISLILKRLEDSFGKPILNRIELNGVPKDFKSAIALANKKEDKTRKEFEKWAILRFSDNRAMIHEKKGGDGGIDGIALMIDLIKNKQKYSKILFSVKSDKSLSPSVVRDLFGTMNRDDAVMGYLLTLYKMKNLIKEAKKYGIYKNQLLGMEYPVIQVISAEEILDGARIKAPVGSVLKEAKAKIPEQASLFSD